MKKLPILFIFLLSVLCAENKIIISDTYTMASIYVNDYTIQGNGEKCKLTYAVDEHDLISSTCVKLTNSKGIKIFCTPGKKICKTEGEIINLFANKETKQPTPSKYKSTKQSPPKMKRIFGQASNNTQTEVDADDEVTAPADWSRQLTKSEIDEMNEEYEKKCDAGDIQSCMNLGSLKSEEYYEIAYTMADKSCNSGVEDACYKLADFYICGLGNIKKNNHRANELLHQACNGGHKYACGALNERAELFYIDTPQKTYLTDEYKTRLSIASSCVVFHDLDSGEVLSTCGNFKIDYANRKSVENAEKVRKKQSPQKNTNNPLATFFAVAKSISDAKYACSEGGTHKGYLIERENLGYDTSKKTHVYRSYYKCIKCEKTYTVTH